MTCGDCWKCCIVTCQSGRDTEESYSFARCCRVTCIQFCKWIPVWILWILIFWVYYVYVGLLCIDIVEDITEKALYLTGFHLLLFMVMWSYIRTIFTNISRMPSEFYLTDDQVTELRNEEKMTTRRTMLQNLASFHEFQTTTKDRDIRYCEQCRCLKPDRCHHCSICQTCVLKMDHHCPWTNNCVGFLNYKFFLLLVAYSVMWCLLVAATVARFTVAIFMTGERLMYLQANIVILQFISVAFSTVCLSLLIYHLYLIRSNITTLETLYPPVFKSGPRSTFSWGCSHNFKQIFGENVFLWFLPVHTSLGDGVKFPVARPVEDMEQP